MSDITVLKFGGSFLRGPADLVRATHVIYAEVRAGRRVVAITSAFHGRTDELEESLRSLDADRGVASSRRVRASLLATGEVETSTILTQALVRSGVPAAHADVRHVGPFVREGTEEPARLDVERFAELFHDHAVVCLPGFVGAEDTPERALALLGRGGSDLSAVFVARELGARVALVKDVEGLYTSDPAGRDADTPTPRRLARASYTDALSLGPDILQPRAVRFAQATGQEFDVVGPGHVAGARGTRVSARSTVERGADESTRPLRVALLGLGTVGARVFAELSGNPDRFEVVSILVRDTARRGRPTAAVPLLTSDFSDVVRARPDLVVEATSGADPAREWISALLEGGVHVVTANKAAVAQATPRFDELARKHGAQLLASAAVGGALPALESTRRAANSDDALVGIEGILNGTSGAVLSAMREGASLAEAVADARERGLAEADPTFDLDGTDVSHKLELLAEAAGWTNASTRLRWLHRAGIDRDTVGVLDDGAVAKLVGSVWLSDVGPVASVSVRHVGPSDVLHDVDGPENALLLHRASGVIDVVRGTGAGAWPTATSVLGDVHQVARRLASVGHGAGRAS